MSDQNFVTLTVADGTKMRAYTAFPSTTGPVPGIILLQEAFGVNHHIRNAMQIILYQATLTQADPEQIEQVENAVRRVDAALHEIFPILGDRKSDEPAHHDLIH